MMINLKVVPAHVTVSLIRVSLAFIPMVVVLSQMRPAPLIAACPMGR
jgi:hypothetical protein